MKSDLFNRMDRTAVLSDDGLYRYSLQRRWDGEGLTLVVCMLNPSTADHTVDDPTILALIHFCKLWGYGGFVVVNLYAWRSPSPSEMMRVDQRVGPKNRATLEQAMQLAAMIRGGGRLLVAWGNDGDFEGEAEWFASRAVDVHRLELICLGTTRSGAPKHPMARGHHRIPRDLQPIIWRRPIWNTETDAQ